MRMILSPAKKMREAYDILDYQELPVFLNETETILRWIQQLSYEQAKKLWMCNDQIAKLNYERYANMDLKKQLTPAVLAYDGIAFQYMAPAVFEYGQFVYIQKYLRILSGFYGVLKPMDGVTPYRLEMQAKTKISGTSNLYEYWGNLLYQEVMKGNDNRIILNLASKEYSRCIEAYLTPDDTYISCIFGELAGEKIVQKGVHVKMARGEMVRFMAENQISEPEKIKNFNHLGYQYEDKLSTEKEYVFITAGDDVGGKKDSRMSIHTPAAYANA